MFMKNGHIGRLCINEVADIEDWKDMLFLGNKAAKIPHQLNKNDGLIKCKIIKQERNVTYVSMRPTRLEKNKIENFQHLVFIHDIY